ncbi:amino acid kinase family protein [Methylobacter tundripaludum]|uniref:Aspartate/glutamate/uridylate kinase n=1 Tax=Methylobacter tundripaludum (strain ATCC BAA-1195 / DSM 17260 / SV96) TaxID=697282 RepID=G3IY01_METTV|nr:uridylate kinase [Methylobacter tundripaludum]EGW21098.1 aspartate/glutamate/uridylate kinase [Methylobacter tundripaludum SV96]
MSNLTATDGIIIIKLGGSLSRSDTLVNCLNAVEKNYQGRAVVVVPGGGGFADQVRLAQQQWQFDDTTAHHMALLAMQQMALMFKGLKPDFAIADTVAAIHDQLNRKKTVIWSPDIIELDNAGIEASWDITSDSLAAWLAKTVSATELILIKSAAIDTSLSLQQLAEQNIVDKAFCDFVAKAAFKTQVINAQSWAGG